MKRFTPQEDQYIRDNYLDKKLQEMADELGRSFGVIAGRMGRLGLKVPEEIKRQRLLDAAQKQTSNAGRFKKGHNTHNKGKKVEEYMSPKGAESIKKTQFKKGNKPHNSVPVGTISIHKVRSRGYQYIKIGHPGKWELLHRYVWQENFGKIPPKHNVQFKDGNPMNCEPENLYLIDKKGNMAQNSIMRYPREVITAIKTVSKLNKKIQEYETN